MQNLIEALTLLVKLSPLIVGLSAAIAFNQ
jgi:hypothetical protein